LIARRIVALLLVCACVVALARPARADEVSAARKLRNRGMGVALAGMGLSIVAGAVGGVGIGLIDTGGINNQPYIFSASGMLVLTFVLLVVGIPMWSVGGHRLSRLQQKVVLGPGGVGVRF
jgi:threonine/homoserine/homoserine lactone efflux protein